MTPRIVIFVHIPKTAGMAFWKVIQRSFPASQIYDLKKKNLKRIIPELGELSSRKPPGVSVITGHQPYGLHTALAAPFTYATMLRDPVERLLSFYYYVREQPKHPLHEPVTSGALTLLDVARIEANRQTRMLAGRRRDETGEDDLALAKLHLETHFTLAGFVERFEESIALMQWLLGWPFRPYTPENVTGRRGRADSLTPGELRAIRACNEMDFELCEFAARRFDRLLAEQPAAFHRRSAALHLTSRVAGALTSMLHRKRKPAA